MGYDGCPMPKLRHIYFAGVIAAAALFSGCGDEKPDETGGKKNPPREGGPTGGDPEVPELPAPTEPLSKSVEAFTGSHTKIVWAAHQNEKHRRDAGGA